MGEVAVIALAWIIGSCLVGPLIGLLMASAVRGDQDGAGHVAPSRMNDEDDWEVDPSLFMQ